MDTRLTTPRKEKALDTTIRKEIEALRQMTVGQLKKKYAEVVGEEIVDTRLFNLSIED